MLALFKKELSGYFSSAIGYIAILVFLIVMGLILWVFPDSFNVLDFGYANINGFFILAPFIFLFLIPAITMRTFAEEKRTGTFETLSSKPLSSMQIVLAKYFSSCVVILLSLVPTLVFYYTVYYLGSTVGNIDSGAVFGSYAVICTFMYLGFETIYQMRIFGDMLLFVKNLGMQAHYASLSRGVIDTRDVVYYLSIIFVFLMFTKFSIERRK